MSISSIKKKKYSVIWRHGERTSSVAFKAELCNFVICHKQAAWDDCSVRLSLGRNPGNVMSRLLQGSTTFLDQRPDREPQNKRTESHTEIYGRLNHISLNRRRPRSDISQSKGVNSISEMQKTLKADPLKALRTLAMCYKSKTGP
ncbi:hypothetical protein CAPTEDRAFT_200746 [Capitella teleta]|uniref:Uncharacterized protein n=1 Tax=Capitella teleta TaxID=283909 RepID=R7TCW7_CAPTE|nr:hypothetical protein CAPTEDRAFT_200746 [Capitella teleta]|eukprot:ELT91312.1 hypothetical protein CAPTEDRAFT_200746 [Capitella teleta]